MKRKFMGLFLMLTLLVGCLPTVAWADNVDNVIQQRIDDLYNKIGNKFFTVNQQPCAYGAWGHGCDNCKNEHIVNASWFKNMFGSCSAYNFANSYANGHNNGRVGWSCFGFANFAEWYIFKSSNSDQITTDVIGTYNFNYNNISSYAKKGDVFRLDDKHSVIFISATSSGISVLDCNWSVSGGNCKVEKHMVSYSYASTFTICRARNRGSIIGDTTHIAAPTVTTTKPTYSYGSTVTVNWNSVSGADGYSIYLYGENTGVTTLNTTETSWSSVLSPDNYTIWVNSFNSTDWVASSAVKFTVNDKISAPTVTTTKPTYSYGSTVTVKWNSVRGADGYSIYLYGENTGVTTLNTTETSWSSVLSPDNYTIWINSFTETEWVASSAVKFTVNDKISAPTATTTKSTYSYGSTVTVNWSSVIGADGYSIYLYGENTGVTTFNTTETSWSSVLSPDNYTIWINSFTETEWMASNSVTFTVTPEEPVNNYPFSIQKKYGYATITNNTSEQKKADVIVAEYNGEVLINIETYHSFIAPDNPLDINVNSDNYKVFVWDSLEGMKPLAN